MRTFHVTCPRPYDTHVYQRPRKEVADEKYLVDPGPRQDLDPLCRLLFRLFTGTGGPRLRPPFPLSIIILSAPYVKLPTTSHATSVCVALPSSPPDRPTRGPATTTLVTTSVCTSREPTGLGTGVTETLCCRQQTGVEREDILPKQVYKTGETVRRTTPVFPRRSFSWRGPGRVEGQRRIRPLYFPSGPRGPKGPGPRQTPGTEVKRGPPSCSTAGRRTRHPLPSTPPRT